MIIYRLKDEDLDISNLHEVMDRSGSLSEALLQPGFLPAVYYHFIESLFFEGLLVDNISVGGTGLVGTLLVNSLRFDERFDNVPTFIIRGKNDVPGIITSKSVLVNDWYDVKQGAEYFVKRYEDTEFVAYWNLIKDGDSDGSRPKGKKFFSLFNREQPKRRRNRR